MVYSSNSFFFALSQKHGLVGCGILVIKHAIIGRTAGYPHTPLFTPRVFQGSLDGANELLMVIPFPRLNQRLATAWSHLPTRVTAGWQQVTLCFFVHHCQVNRRSVGTGFHLNEYEKSNLPSGCCSICLNKKRNHSQNERGECGLQRLFYTYT